jgi:hypothetical protein
VFEPGIVCFQVNGRQPPASDIVALPYFAPPGKVFEVAHLDGAHVTKPPPRPALRRDTDHGFIPALAGNDILG